MLAATLRQVDSHQDKLYCLIGTVSTPADRGPTSIHGISILRLEILIFMLIQSKVRKYESWGTGELSSLIMNTLGSQELKRECESDASAPSVSPTVCSLFTLCHVCRTRLTRLRNRSDWREGSALKLRTTCYYNNVATMFSGEGHICENKEESGVDVYVCRYYTFVHI